MSPPFAEDAHSVPPDGSTVQSMLLFYQSVYLVQKYLIFIERLKLLAIETSDIQGPAEIPDDLVTQM